MSDTFGQLLRRLRREAGLSQEALAELSGLSKDAISTLERGARRAPYRETVVQLAAALALPPAQCAQLELTAARGRARRSGASPESRRLPVPSGPLVGRDDAVAHVCALLERSHVVTVAGTGGIGKTRVALAAAERFANERQAQAWFVDLAALRSGDEVAGKIASTLGTLVSAAGGLEELFAPLRSRTGLIVLDNCEHVIANAAAAAAAIVRACPGLWILATSRERLALDGEHVYALGGLAPGAALELFDLRAASVAAQFAMTPNNAALAADICRHVESIPLAIELAAARVPFLGLSELRARLRGQLGVLDGGRRDAPARQRTMYDTLVWSHELLGAAERVLFRRLAIFSGGWSIDALAAVATGDGLDDDAAMVAFSSLVEKSLVSAEFDAVPVRYRLLEPVRAFSLAQLDDAGERDVLSRRHAHWAAALAQSTQQQVGLFAREIDNLRAALEWALGDGRDPVLAARIVGGPGGAWARTGLLGECRRWCEAALASLDGDAHPDLAVRVYRTLVVSMGGRDEIDAIQRAIPYCERAGDWNGVAVFTSRLALRYGERGRFEEAERAFARVWELRDRMGLGTTSEWSTVMMHRSSVYRRQGLLADAQRAISESIALARSLDRPLHEMWALLVEGEIAFARGEPDRAILIAAEALAVCRAQQHAVGEILSRANLAGYYLATGNVEDATTHATAALDRGQNAEARLVLAAVLHLAAAAAIEGDAERAAVLKGYLDAARGREEVTLDPTEASSYGILAAQLERALGADVTAIRARQGARLSAFDAAELARTSGPSQLPAGTV